MSVTKQIIAGVLTMIISATIGLGVMLFWTKHQQSDNKIYVQKAVDSTPKVVVETSKQSYSVANLDSTQQEDIQESIINDLEKIDAELKQQETNNQEVAIKTPEIKTPEIKTPEIKTPQTNTYTDSINNTPTEHSFSIQQQVDTAEEFNKNKKINDEIIIIVNNSKFKFDKTFPYRTEENIIMVPAKFFSDAFGYEVIYKESKGLIYITRYFSFRTMTGIEKTADGFVAFEVSEKIKKNDTIFVPLKAVADCFGKVTIEEGNMISIINECKIRKGDTASGNPSVKNSIANISGYVIDLKYTDDSWYILLRLDSSNYAARLEGYDVGEKHWFRADENWSSSGFR